MQRQLLEISDMGTQLRHRNKLKLQQNWPMHMISFLHSLMAMRHKLVIKDPSCQEVSSRFSFVAAIFNFIEIVGRSLGCLISKR